MDVESKVRQRFSSPHRDNIPTAGHQYGPAFASVLLPVSHSNSRPLVLGRRRDFSAMNGSHAGFSGQHARVSITGPPAFLASPNWTKVHSAVTAQLPLRNIHWKSPGRGSLRTIQELDVALVPFDTLRDEHSQVPTTVLEKPLLHVYIIHCEVRHLLPFRHTLTKWKPRIAILKRIAPALRSRSRTGILP